MECWVEPMDQESERTRVLQERIRQLEAQATNYRDECSRLRSFIDGALDYAFVQLSPDNLIADWNAGAERLLGYKEEEVLGQPGSIFFTPEDVNAGQVQEELKTAGSKGSAADERWHMRKDGTRFWGSGTLRPLMDSNGVLSGYSKIFRDLTERKLAEDRLRQSEEHFRLLVENVTECALFQVDCEGRISGWNPGAERTFGYTQEEILGKPFDLLFSEEDRAAGWPGNDLKLAFDGCAENERWVVRKDGTHLYARWFSSTLRDVHGQIAGLVKILRDDTDRKLKDDLKARAGELEREYLQAQFEKATSALESTKEDLKALAGNLLTVQEEERRRIARELHDDLAQRLAMLLVGLTGLKNSVPVDFLEARDELSRLEQQTSALSNDVRGLSYQLHPSLLDDLGLAAALDNLVEEFRSAGTHQFTFEADEIEGTLSLPVAGALYRIAQEAMRNISKHAASGFVAVRLKQHEQKLILSISDSGPGFDPEVERGRRGLGIISMAERAILIGGTLTISSKVGGQTTVTVAVPLTGTA
jgi:PAS domain S-box-containing protein